MLWLSSWIYYWDLNIPLSLRSSYGKFKGGQVKKILKISTCGIYCNLFENNISLEDDPIFTLCYDSKFEPKRYDYLINPFDLTVSLLVCCLGVTISFRFFYNASLFFCILVVILTTDNLLIIRCFRKLAKSI